MTEPLPDRAPQPAPTDAEWYRTVYRPREAQFTVRAVVFGCLIGSVLSAANLYTGFTIGWTYGASITAAISAYVVFKTWAATAGGRPFTVLENNTMQTSASAAAAMAGAGMVNAVPALMVLTGRQLSFFQIAAWLISVAFLGLCFAIPLKRQMINMENLKFPSGIAAAAATLALHGEGHGGKQKAIALGATAGLGALLCWVRSGLGRIPESLPVVGPMIRGHSFGKLTLQVDVSLLSLGAGALIGLRTAAWMAVGATICWAFLIPWAIEVKAVIPPATGGYFGRGARWCMWPGVTVLVVSGVLSFLLKAKTIVAAFRSVGTLKAAVTGTDGDRQEDVEIPIRWFGWAFLGASTLCIVTQWVVFDMHPLLTVVAIALAGVLAMVGTRAVGETDVNPIGGMGKVTQLIFAILAPGNVQANLMSAGIAAAGANNCGDMMQDLKTGRLLGASPRKQFWAQVFGISVGGLVTVFVFTKAFPLHLLGTKYPAPAVQTWKGMAELLTKGLGNLPPYTPTAILIAAIVAVVLTLLAEIGPVRMRTSVPSATGLGLSFILPASSSYTFLVGAAIAAVVARNWPTQDDLYTVAAASGAIAGESVAGVAVAIHSASAGH